MSKQFKNRFLYCLLFCVQNGILGKMCTKSWINAKWIQNRFFNNSYEYNSEQVIYNSHEG